MGPTKMASVLSCRSNYLSMKPNQTNQMVESNFSKIDLQFQTNDDRSN